MPSPPRQYRLIPEIKPRADVLVTGQRDAGSTRTSIRKTFAFEWVIKVVVQLTIATWLALEAWLLIPRPGPQEGQQRAGSGNALA
jgi:hypothetical protein